MDKKIIIGADPSGCELKEAVKEHLIKKGYLVDDVGTKPGEEAVEYYDVGYRVASAVSKKEYERGIVFCGTGMGVSLVANKVPGAYCGVVESVYTARLCRYINNCNMLALGGFLNGKEKACAMVDAFLDSDFAPVDFWIDSKLVTSAYAKVQSIEKKLYH